MDRLRRLTLAEQATISTMQQDAVIGALDRVLGGIGITAEQRGQARSMLSAEFAKLSVEDLP